MSVVFHPFRPFSAVFLLECGLCLLMGLTYLVDLAVKGGLHITGDKIYGYTIVVDALGMTSWIFAIGLLFRERSRVILCRPHGFSLVLFWLSSALWRCMEVSWCPASGLLCSPVARWCAVAATFIKPVHVISSWTNVHSAVAMDFLLSLSPRLRLYPGRTRIGGGTFSPLLTLQTLFCSL